MRALLFSIAAVVTLGACGGPPAQITAPPPVAPPPPAYEVVRSANLGVLAADDRHVYWVDGGIHRRAHGGAAPAERLFVSDGWIDRLAVGSADVFFSDDGYRLRAIPKSGGAPSELAALDEGLTGLVADGDGVWVLTGSRLERWSRELDEKKLELPGAGTTLAIDRARGEAFVTVRDGDATLYRVDLASGKATALSSEWFFADALAIGVSGSSIVAAVRDGLVMMPRAGGEASFAMPATAYAIAVDDRGYAVSTSNALIAQLRGEPPRVLGTSNQSWWSGSSPGVALGGGYAYHIVYATDDQGTGILRGEPRTGRRFDAAPSSARCRASRSIRDATLKSSTVGDGTRIEEPSDMTNIKTFAISLGLFLIAAPGCKSDRDQERGDPMVPSTTTQPGTDETLGNTTRGTLPDTTGTGASDTTGTAGTGTTDTGQAPAGIGTGDGAGGDMTNDEMGDAGVGRRPGQRTGAGTGATGTRTTGTDTAGSDASVTGTDTSTDRNQDVPSGTAPGTEDPAGARP